MASLNKVLMIGRLTKDPDLRYLPSGVPKATARLASSRTYWDRQGEKQQDVCYIDVVFWQRKAEVVKEYLTKGRQILIEGRLDFQEWETDGQRRSRHQIVADRFEFLDYGKDADKPKPSGEKMYGGNAYEDQPVSDNTLPDDYEYDLPF